MQSTDGTSMTFEVEEEVTTRQATLKFLLKHGESSASNLAAFIGVSVQVMRRHLRSLEEAGFVEAKSISFGPGRPSNLWQLTTQGQNRFHDGSERFALDLLRSIEATLSSETIEVLLKNQALEKATDYRKQIGEGSIKQRLEKLVELRNKDGYLAECELLKDGAGWHLKQFTCSISGIAEKYHSVCDQELEFISHIFPDCRVTRVQWRLEFGHSCGFQIVPIELDV